MKSTSPFRFLFSRPRLAALFVAALFAPASVLADGAVVGILKDATHGTPLPGASVKLSPGNREAVTDRAGAFHFPQLPAGSYTLEASYLGLETQTTSIRVVDGQTTRADAQLGAGAIVMAAFTVESFREGQSRAINQQRTANTIMSVISADAIGNLPDRTVGEALARLPGVNVVDDSFANIRGTAAEHNAVTLDGDRLSTTGSNIDSTSVNTDTRAVDLSLIPAEMVGGIEVIKTLTAEMDADSFGGTINLVSRSAFELKERSVNGKFEYIHNTFRKQPGRAASITFMDVLGQARTLGLSATLTYRHEDRRTNSYEFAYYDAGAIPVGTSGSGTAGPIASVGDQAMEAYDTRLNFQEITKLGGTVNLDWKLSDATELHFRTFYENTETEGGRFRNRLRALSRWDASSTATLQSGRQVRFQNYMEEGTREQDVLRLGFEGKTRLTGGGTLKYGLRHGNSDASIDRDRYIFDFPSNTERRAYSWTIDRRNATLPTVSFTHIATGQNGYFGVLTDRKLNNLRFQTGTEDESDLTANLDYAFGLPLAGRNLEWKFGVKHRGKDRSSRQRIVDVSAPTVNQPTFANFRVLTEPRNLLGGTQATMGPIVALTDVVAFYRANSAAFAPLSGDEIVRLEARKYDVNEDILAAYGMATTKIEKLEIIGGLRWEQTKTGYHWLADPLGASRGTRRYDNLYPSLLFNYRLNRNLVARLAYTSTLSRPAYGDLVPYRSSADTAAESGTGGLEPGDYPETNKVFLGNARLKAQQSENFDLSLEYYLPQGGVLSAAAFRKNLTDVIFRAQWKDPATPNTIFFQERNGSSGKASGVELSWQQALSFLPKPLDGFGVNLNATFIDGSSVLEELVPGSVASYRPFRVSFLPEQPETVYNAQLWWEKFGVTARVAVNFIDEFVRTAGGLTSFSINNKATRWDASLSYRVNRRFSIYLEGRNLTDEVTSWYATTPGRPEDYSFTGAIYTGGIKFRF
ncbi:MAG: TonB-dependent receptor [Verrucomicrobia bacterium]|nr:TonB-dependent receptor [Verrucomicrobiota bacterium]